MKTFRPEESQSNVDFLAFSVAKMETENSSISAPSVASSMPAPMADMFFKRLQFYRQQMRQAKTWKKPASSVSGTGI